MTPAEKSNLAALWAASTPGEWGWGKLGHTLYSDDGTVVDLYQGREHHGLADADAAFIAEAHRAVPLLLAECERLEDEIARYREAAQYLRDTLIAEMVVRGHGDPNTITPVCNATRWIEDALADKETT